MLPYPDDPLAKSMSESQSDHKALNQRKSANTRLLLIKALLVSILFFLFFFFFFSSSYLNSIMRFSFPSLGTSFLSLIAVSSLFSPSLAESSQNTSSRWSPGLTSGVDYYPSQWPRSMWEDDAKTMANSSISLVRVNEFDWSLLEPTQGKYNFTVLDDSIKALAAQGLKVIIGTPTATPPFWIVKNYDILPADGNRNLRRFGSRRHYSFSSQDYRKLSRKITKKLVIRYGKNPHVAGWQVSVSILCCSLVQEHSHEQKGNRFCYKYSLLIYLHSLHLLSARQRIWCPLYCEFPQPSTRVLSLSSFLHCPRLQTRTYDENSRKAFGKWLSNRYNGSIDSFNQLQGRVFWSSQYPSFKDVDLPTQEVTESNPALRLDFYRFSSDQLISFAKEQADIIRKYSDPNQFVTTNFMGYFFEFDHFKFVRETRLDIATWDNYPLGEALKEKSSLEHDY